MEIWFDMDGTIADLYGQKNWLADLKAESERPYKNAKPLVNMQVLARRLNRLQKNGYRIGIISWLAKNSTKSYDMKVTQAKQKWLAIHLKSVKFDDVDIIPYGEPKQKGRYGILFDDEEPNRKAWGEGAKSTERILEELKELA